MARTRSASGEWSALSTALFEIASPLRVTELYYNPPGSDESTEFVELINTSSGAVALAGYGFDSDGGGIDFTFDDAEPSLGAGERIVVVRNQAAFAAAYDTAGIRLATGQFDDSQTALANGGEMLTLVDASHVVISRFTYDDAWHRETDGDGFSLVVVDTGGDYDDPANWRSSALVGGSPGAADPTPVVGDFNGDGAATRIDAAILLRNLGRSGDAHRGTGDIDGDLATTLIDLALLQSNLGSTIAASAPAGSAQAPDSRNAAIAAVGREGASHASPTATHRRRTRVAFSLGQHERLQSPPVDAAIREASDLADSLRSTRRNTRAGRLLSSPPANVGRPFQAVLNGPRL
jgi:hypothetical protein